MYNKLDSDEGSGIPVTVIVSRGIVSLYLTVDVEPPSSRLPGFPQTRISENKYIGSIKTKYK